MQKGIATFFPLLSFWPAPGEWGWWNKGEEGNDDKLLRYYLFLYLLILLVEKENVDMTQKVLPQGIPGVKNDVCSSQNPLLKGMLSCHISENTECTLDNIFTYADK